MAKNGKATASPEMGGRDRKRSMQAVSTPAMGTSEGKSDMHHASDPSMGTSEGWDHSQDILDAEGLPLGGLKVGKVSPVMDAKSTHGSKQTDSARATWERGIQNEHDPEGAHADMPMKYAGHAPYHKENPAVQMKARKDHFRRIEGDADPEGDNPVSGQHNNQ